MPFQERQSQDPNAEQKLRLQVDNGIRELLVEMQQGKSDRLAKYLEFSARFHRYSVHNQFLIYLQCPQVTFVTGYRRWQEWGYQVGKGEKGIRILAPHPYQKSNEETGEVQELKFFKRLVYIMEEDGIQVTDASLGRTQGVRGAR